MSDHVLPHCTLECMHGRMDPDGRAWRKVSRDILIAVKAGKFLDYIRLKFHIRPAAGTYDFPGILPTFFHLEVKALER